MKKNLLYCITLVFMIQNVYAVDTINENGITIKINNVFSALVKKTSKDSTRSETLTKIKLLENKIRLYLESNQITGSKFIMFDNLLKLSREYISEEEYYQKTVKSNIILNKYSITNNFTHKILNRNDVFLENGIWYTYIFTSHLSFSEGVIPTENDLVYNKISTKDDLVFLTEDNTIGYVKDYKKVILISNNIIYGIPDKFNFLNEIRDDKKNIQIDSDLDFIKIKENSLKITEGLFKKDDKIEAIYNYILENISYTQPIPLEDKQIFSGIETYKNTNGVCEGYVKYFQYLLQFSGIQDVSSIRGYVIDAQDYPNIGHAWTKIGDYYYDPTFDDPIGQSETKIKKDYIYYKLPEDLFYTNRYDYSDNNEILEKSPLDYRKQYIKKQLITVYPKYKNTNYNIIKDLKFKDEYNLDYYDSINIESFKKSIGFHKVTNFKYTKDGKDFIIKKLQFFTLSDSLSIESILKQIDYNLESYTLFEWEDSDGSITYRLGFDIQY